MKKDYKKMSADELNELVEEGELIWSNNLLGDVSSLARSYVEDIGLVNEIDEYGFEAVEDLVYDAVVAEVMGDSGWLINDITNELINDLVGA